MILWNNWRTAYNNWHTAYYTDPEIQFLFVPPHYLFFKTPEPEVEQKDCVDYQTCNQKRGSCKCFI